MTSSEALSRERAAVRRLFAEVGRHPTEAEIAKVEQIITTPEPSLPPGHVQPSTRVVVVTGEAELRLRLLKLAQDANVAALATPDPGSAGRHYRTAMLVLAGADQATACLSFGLPIWGDLLIVATENDHLDGPGVRSLERVKVVSLPSSESWLRHRLREERPIEDTTATAAVQPEPPTQEATLDLTAAISTVAETRAEVRWLVRALRALLDHYGISHDQAEESDTGL